MFIIHAIIVLTSTPGTSHMLHDVQNIVEVPVLSRKAWHTELSSSHQLCFANVLNIAVASAASLAPSGASRT